jgi:hypothetical protein
MGRPSGDTANDYQHTRKREEAQQTEAHPYLAGPAELLRPHDDVRHAVVQVLGHGGAVQDQVLFEGAHHHVVYLGLC